MNRRGNPETLVATHEGNLNALKSGVQSPRLIQMRAAAIKLGLEERNLDQAGQVVLSEVCRLMALVEAIDRDLDERGLTDRNGKERYLLQRRERYSRTLMEMNDRLLDALNRARRETNAEDGVIGEQKDYVQELQRIALGRDPDARVSERITALKLLVALGRSGASSFYEPSEKVVPFQDDPVFQAKVKMLEKEFEEARKTGYLNDFETRIMLARHG